MDRAWDDSVVCACQGPRVPIKVLTSFSTVSIDIIGMEL